MRCVSRAVVAVLFIVLLVGRAVEIHHHDDTAAAHRELCRLPRPASAGRDAGTRPRIRSARRPGPPRHTRRAHRRRCRIPHPRRAPAARPTLGLKHPVSRPVPHGTTPCGCVVTRLPDQGRIFDVPSRTLFHEGDRRHRSRDGRACGADRSRRHQPRHLGDRAAVHCSHRRPAVEPIASGRGSTSARPRFVFDAASESLRARHVRHVASEPTVIELEEGYFNLAPRPAARARAQGRASTACGFGHAELGAPARAAVRGALHVLAAYLPGQEALNETGVSLSRRIPVHGRLLAGPDGRLAARRHVPDRRAIRAGDPSDPLALGRRRPRGRDAPGVLGRLSRLRDVGRAVGARVRGVGDGRHEQRRGRHAHLRFYGADVKAKLWTGPRAYLVLQAEGLQLDREDAGWDPVPLATRKTAVTPMGGYVYADYNWATRYNVGASYEGFQRTTANQEWDQSVGAFAGFSLLEETTAFRADWRRIHSRRRRRRRTNSRLRVIFSMGPHKAHQFYEGGMSCKRRQGSRCAAGPCDCRGTRCAVPARQRQGARSPRRPPTWVRSPPASAATRWRWSRSRGPAPIRTASRCCPRTWCASRARRSILKVGLGLDQWADQIIDGSHNGKLMVVDCSKGVTVLEKPTGKVDASMGDVHPDGNPHYWLDPRNGAIVARNDRRRALTASIPRNAADYAAARRGVRKQSTEAALARGSAGRGRAREHVISSRTTARGATSRTRSASTSCRRSSRFPAFRRPRGIWRSSSTSSRSARSGRARGALLLGRRRTVPDAARRASASSRPRPRATTSRRAATWRTSTCCFVGAAEVQ